MNILLIAGRGPLRLSENDLSNSYFDSNVDRSVYFLNSLNCTPDNLVYENNGEQVLTTKKNHTPELIVATLRSAFDFRNIPYVFLDINNIWNDNKSSITACDIVCLSTSFMWSEEMLDYAIKWIDLNVQYKYFIIGGQYAVLKYKTILNNYRQVDYVSLGDVDNSLIPLIQAIESGGEIDEVYDVAFKNDKKILKTMHHSVDMDKYPRPFFYGIQTVIPYISMKGCVYNCAFCAQSACCHEFKFRSSDLIYQDWEYYKYKNRTSHFDVHDSTFFIPFKRIKELLPKISKLGVTWEANIRADTPLTPNMVASLERSGCVALFFGFESMSDVVLEFMNKKTNSMMNKRVNELLKKSSIETTMSFIVGFPGETDEEFMKTRNYLLNDHCGFFTINVFELEDETMPIYKQREKFKIRTYPDNLSGDKWLHGGMNWEHCGMNSSHAKELRKALIRDVRLSNSLSVYRSWQYYYEIPLIKDKTKVESLKIEKLIDRLVFVPQDYETFSERVRAIERIMIDLGKYGIVGSKNEK